MPRKNRFLSSFLSIILILSITLTNVNVAFADEGPTPDPAVTAEPTQPPVDPTEPPVEATEPVVQPTVESTESSELPTEPAVVATQVATEAPVVEENTEPVEQAPITELLSQAPENTELVVLDENGEALSLTSQEALDTILDTDPMWCPAGVLPGGAGCTTNFATISALMTDMINNTNTYDENGIIYFTTTPGAPFSLTTTSLGATDFNTLNDFNLTLQGGWNGSNGALATFTGQTNFGSNTLTIGSSGNPWVGNLTLNNFSFSNVSSGAAVTVYTTSGNITLDNVDVSGQTNGTFTTTLNSTSGNITVQNGSTFDGNSSNESQGFSATTGTGSITISDTTFSDSRRNGTGNTYDGATLNAPIVTLTNVTTTGSDGDGIAINNVNVVTLNNVTATNNGTESGSSGLSGNDGSGVLINGNAGSSVIINGGTFTGNQEYGVEVASPANTTIYIQSNPTCTGNDSNAAPTSSCYNDTTIFDNTAPVITSTISGTAGSNGWYTSNVTVSWTVTDGESGIKSSTGCTTSNLTSETSGSTLTCSATNNAGLSSSASVTIKIDKTGPTATLSIISGTVGSNGWYTSDVTIQTSGTDTISSPVTCTANQFQTTDTASAVFNGSCTNNAGLTTSASPLTIKVDKTGPITTLTVVAGTAGNNGWYTSDVTIQTTGTESASNPVTCTANQSQTTETAGTVFNGSCTNNAGLTTNATPVTIKLDKTNPVISFVNSTPSPNVNGWNNSDVTVNWSCTDGLSGPVSASVSQTISTEGANQSATGTCQDMAGNSASDTQSGFNIDKTDPILNLPADMTVEATSLSGATVNYLTSASDNLDAAPSFSCTPASGSNFVIGTTMVNCTATDHADNISFGNFNITVQDINGPVIEVHADITVETTSALGALVTYTSPATLDAVDGPGAADCTPASGGTFPIGDTTVTCTAMDTKGNLATPTTFVVHVVDTTGPVIDPHLDITVEATFASGALVTYTSPAASDIVDGSVSVLCAPSSGTTFAIGNTNVTCNATDAHNNAAIPTTFVIHVVDTTAPVIAPHADITAEATSASGAVVTYTSPTASDTVDGPVSVSCSPASGTTFALGNTTVTCNTIDAHNNPAVPTSFVVHVVDTTAPVIGPHADVNVAATSSAGALVNYTNPATSDAVDGPGTATCTPPSGDPFALGDTTVNCTATDANGNQAIPTSFVVHVIDTTAPVIDGHLDETVEATSAAGAIASYTSPATSDAVDGADIATCLPASGTFFDFGDTTVTCNATDSNGNDATPTSFVVHVVDTTAPAIAAHADVTAEATSSSGAAVTYSSPATSDAVDGEGVASCLPASGTTFALGNTTVTCNAADANNNLSTPSTFVVNVVDTTAPVIAAHADVAVTTNNTLGSIVTYSSPATSDAVDGPGTASCSPASGSFFPVGDTLVTCTATDAHGNAAQSITFNVHVEYQAIVITPTPEPSTPSQGIDLSVPVTGGLLDLDCLTVVDSFGIKITFHNLCDYQAAIADVQADTLPSPLPGKYSFVQGLNVLVLFEQQVVKDLPTGAGVQLDFPVPANTQDQFAVLLWDDQDGDGKGEWLDVTQLIKDQELSKVLSADPNDELYELVPTKTFEAFYRVITTEKTGTFVLVKK